MTSDYERQSSSEVADEADDVRAGLAQTLDQLRNNLRPENMVEEVVSNARIGASTLADGLYGLARQNPLPALLIGAGCALFMGLGARKALKSDGVLEHEPADAMMSLQPRFRGLAAGSNAVHTSAAGEARSGGGVWQRPIDESANEISSKARGNMSRLSKSMAQSRRRVASQLPGVLHEQPLILAALGVAVGAAIGAALPTTSTEDEWMGGTSASVRHAAEDVARDEIDELRSVASRAADNYKQAASDHGLSVENLSGLARDIGDHTKSAIHDVGGSLGPTKA
ncbi:MAG TPA: hypothetical protein VH414_22350 [Lichenihabitans sp.]|jgi:ElaB/YqjD/DUF883 family membrane-anchored ribosome-binding protein|nr:hypothetical protein [Lichenihabitans sp.]